MVVVDRVPSTQRLAQDLDWFSSEIQPEHISECRSDGFVSDCSERIAQLQRRAGAACWGNAMRLISLSCVLRGRGANIPGRSAAASRRFGSECTWVGGQCVRRPRSVDESGGHSGGLMRVMVTRSSTRALRLRRFVGTAHVAQTSSPVFSSRRRPRRSRCVVIAARQSPSRLPGNPLSDRPGRCDRARRRMDR